jgi:hypothetical protein
MHVEKTRRPTGRQVKKKSNIIPGKNDANSGEKQI